MINVSENFKLAAKAPVKVLEAEITCGEDTFRSSDTLVGFTKEESGYYFGAMTKSLDFTLLGNNYDLLGKTVSVNLSLVYQNAYEPCELGSFVVYEQSSDLEKKITMFKAYDVVGVMAKTIYEPGAISYPCTVTNLVSQIAEMFDLAYEPEELPNFDHVIVEDLWAKISNVTYRDILAEVAGASATIASVSDGRLIFKAMALIPDDNWSYDNLKKVKLEKKYGPVNSVVLARTPAEDNIVLTDDESVAINGLTEIKLANNEILDDNRETMIAPILTACDGFEFYPFEATTEGHGWHECGDRIELSDGTNTWSLIITSVKLTIDGGVKEIIKGVAPTESQTNYALAGGITKTIYNTEIKVDKQGQTIESIVEEQTSFENQTNDNFTQVTQNISNVITSVQNSGGNNLIRNSAMYSLDDAGNPLSWTLSNGGSIIIAPSAEAAVNSSLSRQNISLKGKTASQIIEVKADDSSIVDKTYYSFSCKIKKTAVGECWVRISDSTATGIWGIELANGEESFYNEFAIEEILPNSSNLTITVYGSPDSEFSITDMMLAVGNYRSQWTQANGEFANTQVTIDNSGVTIRSNTLDGVYTKQTPQELSAYVNSQLVATVNDDGISAPKAVISNQISMPPIKIVPQSDGWAFVRSAD